MKCMKKRMGTKGMGKKEGMYTPRSKGGVQPTKTAGTQELRQYANMEKGGAGARGGQKKNSLRKVYLTTKCEQGSVRR